MATKIFGAIGLSTGTGGLKTIKTATISDGDICMVTVNSGEEFYVYTFDSGNVTADDGLKVIKPTDVVGTEAWVICDMTMGIATILETLSVGGASTLTGNVTIGGSLDIGTSTAVTGVLDEDAMGSDSAVDLATQQSIKAYVDAAVSGVTVSYNLLSGFQQTTTFAWSDADTITLQPARYHHNGTAEQIVEWDAAITFNFGSGGSNAASDDLGVSEWHYLYIDDSALSGTTITAARLRNSSTAPTWNASELGWYGGGDANDKCIGAFYSNASSQLDKFYQCNNKITWDVETEIVGSVTSSFADKTARAPAFATNQRIECVAYCSKAGNSGNWYWRHNDQTDSTGHIIGYCFNFGSGDGKFVYTVNNFEPVIDSTQVFEVKAGGSDSTSFINQVAYYLPRGM
jgi:hypothetical protein